MKNQAKWTFMVYLAGDNNLSDAGVTDLDEMSEAGSTAEVNIVAEFDRIGDQHHSKRFYVKPGELQEVVDLGETDCGDPNVLLDFVSWTAKEYPADRYALVLWNHGGGWQPSSIDEIATEVKTKGFSRSEGKERSSSPLGRVFFRTTMTEIFSLESTEERAICSDDGTGHSLDTIELGKVLERIVGEDVLGQPLDLLGMDACLMSNLEVAYQARPFVKYVVASEENEPFDGWPYDTVLAKLVAEPGIATADFGAHIVDAYIASYKGSGNTVTQSALDLSQIDTLTGPLDELSQALVAHMPDAAYEIWSAQKSPAATFFYHTLWDIAHFCERLAARTTSAAVKAAATKVFDALAAGPGHFVVAEGKCGTKVEHCRGVTIYFVPPPKAISEFYSGLDFAQGHDWNDLLVAYHAPD